MKEQKQKLSKIKESITKSINSSLSEFDYEEFEIIEIKEKVICDKNITNLACLIIEGYNMAKERFPDNKIAMDAFNLLKNVSDRKPQGRFDSTLTVTINDGELVIKIDNQKPSLKSKLKSRIIN